MNITTAVYQEDGSILINDSMTVPVDEGNRHYNMVQEWVAEGNVISPYVEPTPPVDNRTDIQKIESATGLTKAQIKSALEIG